MYCVFCGKQIADDCNFCPNCGKRTNTDATASQSAAPDGIRILEQKDPTYRVECEYCRCVFEYKTKNLGYRPWYPSGFVYCPHCQKPLRHHLEYEVKE